MTYPLDLVRTRLAYDVEGRAPAGGGGGGGAGGGAGARRGIAGVLAATVRSEGLGGLYRGIGPTLLGILPYAGLKFYVYQSLKAEYRRRAPGRAHASPGRCGHVCALLRLLRASSAAGEAADTGARACQEATHALTFAASCACSLAGGLADAL